ncbi:MAG: hypothetical protein IPL61_29500 [Myxococcales bacterium]|nr:hypothetical protein [Myxococcales bacterium]
MSRPLHALFTFAACAGLAFGLGRVLLPSRAPVPSRVARGASDGIETSSWQGAPPGAAGAKRQRAAAIADNATLRRDLRVHGAGLSAEWPAIFNEVVLRIHVLGAGTAAERHPMLDCIHGDADSLLRLWVALDSDGSTLRASNMRVLEPELDVADRACLEQLLSPGVELQLSETSRPAPSLQIGLIIPLVLDPRDVLHDLGRLGPDARIATP